jgi:hypothetical protein
MAKQFGNETRPSYRVAWTLEHATLDHVSGVVESPPASHIDPADRQPQPIAIAGRHPDLITPDPEQPTSAPPAIL